MTQLNIIVNIFCSILIIGILVSCSYTIHYFNKYDSSIFLLNKYKIKKFITDENSELNYKEYYKKLLNFYNPFINSYVSTITTITVLGPLLIINLLNLLMNNKINILKNIQFIIGIIILGLSISFIIAVHYIEYKLNIETYDNKKKKIY